MIIEFPSDLDIYFRGLIIDRELEEDPLVVAVIDKEMRPRMAVTLARPFANDFSGVAEASMQWEGWLPFVAVAFTGDLTHITTREQPWEDSLDRMIIELGQKYRVLLSHHVYSRDRSELWMSTDGTPFCQMPGYEFIGDTRMIDRPGASETFERRSETDAFAAQDRIQQRLRR